MKRIVVSLVKENAEGTKNKNVLFNIYEKQFMFTSSASRLSRKVGGIPGCFANNSIKLCVE